MSNAPDPPTPPPEPGEPGTPPGTPPPGEPPHPPAPDKGPDLSTQVAALNRQLELEKKARTKAEARLAQVDAATQTEAEKAAAKAREEGKAEGVKAAGSRLAAAEFRAQATGKLADPSAALEYLDLARFVGEDGEPDVAGITAAVERLAASGAGGKPAPRSPAVPNGVQPGPADDGDWLRSVIKGQSS